MNIPGLIAKMIALQLLLKLWLADAKSCSFVTNCEDNNIIIQHKFVSINSKQMFCNSL